MYAKNSLSSRAGSRRALPLAALALLFAAAPACKKAEPPPPAPAASTQPSAAATMVPAAVAAMAAPGAATAAAVKLQTQTSPEVKMGETTKCPIMKEEFVVDSDSDFALWNGKKVYFCCPGKCKKKFEKEPLKFLPQS